jgi:hypothetical protein
MATFTPVNRSSSASFTPVNRASNGAFDTFERSGTGWDYNELNMTYNQVLDATTNSPVLYNGVGYVATWNNVNKN